MLQHRSQKTELDVGTQAHYQSLWRSKKQVRNELIDLVQCRWDQVKHQLNAFCQTTTLMGVECSTSSTKLWRSRVSSKSPLITFSLCLKMSSQSGNRIGEQSLHRKGGCGQLGHNKSE